jgi:hypothetical protein
VGLKERLALLREDRRQRADELAALDEIIQVLERRVGESKPAARANVRRLAWEVLKAHGRPLTTSEIADAVLLRGYRTKAKNFANAVYMRLSESPEWFKKVGDGWAARGEMPPDRGERSKLKRSE